MRSWEGVLVVVDGEIWIQEVDREGIRPDEIVVAAVVTAMVPVVVVVLKSRSSFGWLLVVPKTVAVFFSFFFFSYNNFATMQGYMNSNANMIMHPDKSSII